MTDGRSLTISRCANKLLIERLLSRYYYDSPVCFFPARVTRDAAEWLANSRAACFIVAESSAEPAGYVFAHTIGPRLWRSFARQHLHLLPYIAYTFLRMCMPTHRDRFAGHMAQVRPHASPQDVQRLALPSVDTPFKWREPDSRTAYIDMVFVANSFRGHGLASRMLRVAAKELYHDGVRCFEAHIDASNYPSLRAFLNAGWNVARTSSNDFKADLNLIPANEQ